MPSLVESIASPMSLIEKLKKELREWISVLTIFIPSFLIFSGLLYELRVIPSESMVPNLQVGDRVTVNKFAYGYSRHSLPFSLGRYIPLPDGRLFASLPQRGDVAVFEHPHTPRVMIKRIIGLPGDVVEIRQGMVTRINGQPIDKTYQRRIRYAQHATGRVVSSAEWRETFAGESWLMHDIDGETGNTTSSIFNVPDGHLLFLGDNRDNSMDGRELSGHCASKTDNIIEEAGCAPRYNTPGAYASVGFVPLQNLVGRADTVLFSTYRCARARAEPCMKNRVWKGL